MLTRLRPRLTYANIIASVALFVALGGTGWAVTKLPRNSVGSKQIRSKAVGRSELRSRAVSSRHLRSGAVSLGKLSRSARAALRGAQGPAGPQGPPGPAGVTHRAAVNSGGGVVRGTAVGASGPGATSEYRVMFPMDVSACVYTATLASVPGGQVIDPPPGRITVANDPDPARVLVKTYDAAGAPAPLPFHLIVAC